MKESNEDAHLLGTIALHKRFLKPDELAEAQMQRDASGEKLGTILLANGVLDTRQLAIVLALRKRHVERTKSKPSPPRATQRRSEAVTPVGLKAGKEVATDDERRQRPTPALGKPRAPQGLTPTPAPTTPTAGEHRDYSSTPRKPMVSRSGHTPTDPPIPSGQRSTATSDRPPPKKVLVQAKSTKPNAWGLNDDVVDAPPPVDIDDIFGSAEDVAADVPAAERAPISIPAPRRSVAPPSLDTLPTLEPLPWDPPTPNEASKTIHQLLAQAVKLGASDVHIHANMRPHARQLGQLAEMSNTAIDKAEAESSLRAILTPWQLEKLDENGEIDLAYALEGVGRFRANIYHHHAGYNGVFHVVPAVVPTLASLGLPETLKKLTSYSQGMILATGPTGCGKTSTLAALVNIINSERDDHILTIEDPIEYLHESKRCVVNQRQVGRHTESFARGLRGALREDPDIICIGELRDLETVSLAMSAAETGHLVLATLHTGSAIGTINRIVGSYPPGQQPQVRSMLSESLRAIVSQRLVPLADGSGVIPALEVLYITKAVGNLIRDNRAFQITSVMQTGKAHGMQRLDDALEDLVRQQKITQETALSYALNKKKFEGGQGAR